MATNDLSNDDTHASPTDDGSTAPVDPANLGKQAEIGPDGRPRGGVVDLEEGPATRGRPRGGVVDL